MRPCRRGRLDEAKTFGGVEKFYGAFGHDDDPLKGRIPDGNMLPATFGAFSGDQWAGEPDRQQRETVAKRMRAICPVLAHISSRAVEVAA